MVKWAGACWKANGMLLFLIRCVVVDVESVAAVVLVFCCCCAFRCCVVEQVCGCWMENGMCCSVLLLRPVLTSRLHNSDLNPISDMNKLKSYFWVDQVRVFFGLLFWNVLTI